MRLKVTLLSVMTYKLLCFCMIVHFTVVASHHKCGYIHVSVGAKSHKVVMNWRYTCRYYPNKLVLIHEGKKVAKKKIKSDKEKVSHMETKIDWDFGVFPGNLYPNSTNPSGATNRCYKTEIVSYRGGRKYDNQCIVVNVRWMDRFETFANLRLGNMLIPGTHRSGAFGKHQHYDFWGQLVFGIRYFDIVIGLTRNGNGKVMFRTSFTPGLLYTQLDLLKRFLEMTKKEVVILDFRGFYDFRSDDDHVLLVNVLKDYLGKWISKRNISDHRYGPKLSELYKNDKRIIINYRYEPMIAKFEFLWDDILIINGKKTTPEDLRIHFKETLRDDSYKQMMRGYVFVLHPSVNTNKRELADKVNPEVSNWYNFDKNQKRVNIIILDFFESSKIHVDAVWINRNYH